MFQNILVMSFLMGTKSEEVYKVFQFFQTKLDTLIIRSISSDFEIAIAQAASKVYKGIKIRKCYFHYSQVCSIYYYFKSCINALIK